MPLLSSAIGKPRYATPPQRLGWNWPRPVFLFNANRQRLPSEYFPVSCPAPLWPHLAYVLAWYALCQSLPRSPQGESRQRVCVTPPVSLCSSDSSWLLAETLGARIVVPASQKRVSKERNASINWMKVTLKLSQDETLVSAAGRDGLLLLNASNCAPLLVRLGVAATVVDSISSVDQDEGAWKTERGVTVDLYGVTKADVCERIWPAMRDLFALECIHVHELGHGFNGCIYDWMRPSSCPMSVRKKAREAAESADARALCDDLSSGASVAPSDPQEAIVGDIV